MLHLVRKNGTKPTQPNVRTSPHVRFKIAGGDKADRPALAPFAKSTTNLAAWQNVWAVPSARAVQSEFQFLCLSDCDLLFGERGFPTIFKTLLHHHSRFVARGCGNPKLAFWPIGCDDDVEAGNKSF